MEPSPWDDASVNSDDTQAPQPIQLNAPSVGTNPFDQQQGMAQQPVLMGATAQMNPYGQQPIIIHQTPSSASKVIGILVIIAGVLGVLSELGSLFMPGLTPTLAGLSVVTVLINAGMLAGGVMMVQYKRNGVLLVIGLIGLNALVGVVALQVVVDYDQMYENGELTDEEYRILSDDSVDGVVSVVGSVFVVFCNAVCMSIVAIPLMIANNGLVSKNQSF